MGDGQIFKECFVKTVQISDEGTSREKDFKKAYNESFRNALSSMSGKIVKCLS